MMDEDYSANNQVPSPREECRWVRSQPAPVKTPYFIYFFKVQLCLSITGTVLVWGSPAQLPLPGGAGRCLGSRETLGADLGGHSGHRGAARGTVFRNTWVCAGLAAQPTQHEQCLPLARFCRRNFTTEVPQYLLIHLGNTSPASAISL